MLYIHLKNICIENLLLPGSIRGIVVLLVNKSDRALVVLMVLWSSENGGRR